MIAAIIYHEAGGGERPLSDFPANPWIVFWETAVLTIAFLYCVYVVRGYTEPREARIRYSLVCAQLFALYNLVGQVFTSLAVLR